MVNWSVRYTLESQFSFRPEFDLVRIGSLIKRSKREVIVQDNTIYKRVTIRTNGKGVTVRDQETGRNIGTKRQFLATEGQFLMSKIDARNGAMGIAPAEIDGAIITADFLAFDINEKLVNSYFFWLLSTTKQFISFCQSCSSGTTNRQRLDEQLFLELRIPLPIRFLQEILVVKYKDNLSQAGLYEIEAQQLEAYTEVRLMQELGLVLQKMTVRKGWQLIDFIDLSRWSLQAVLKDMARSTRTSHYPVKRLGQLCESRSGGTPNKSNSSFWHGVIPWVSPKDMKVDFIEKTEDYITEQAIEKSAAPLLAPNHLLFVVRSGILRHTVPVAINLVPVSINQDMRAFRLIDSNVKLDYLLLYLKYFQHDLLETVKTSTTVESIDSERLNSVEIPLPPLAVQERIIDTLNEMKSRTQTLRANAATLRQNALVAFEQAIFTTASVN
ncbi:MAG: restriction endonuclease subunit S [Spirosoma sp.]|nr:restriction endonuclease subunit S [Spirosoma sp.]